MSPHLLFDFQVDKATNTVTVDREFAAPRDLVWAAWTTPELLDLWWAPRPWHTQTKSMDFREGGRWLYAMVGPAGERHWCRADYDSITPLEQYVARDTFCDEHGEADTLFPNAHWTHSFAGEEDSTTVRIRIQYESLEQLEKIIEMGFREGFTSAMENLDQYIAAQFKLRAQMNPSPATRVCTYLNFPGHTEEAFHFYRVVFRSEFVAPGLVRFSDLPADPNQPPMADNVKAMVLHVELPILGGHILMGTDAPEEMGFTVEKGNNMHIQLEPDSREEAKRLFDELSVGGQVTMPLQDMFWGAYFGSCTDRFGINWMVNCRAGAQ